MSRIATSRQTTQMLFCRHFESGSDGTRTRDLRRDRPQVVRASRMQLRYSAPRGHNGHARGSFGFARVRSRRRMTCKCWFLANGRERARTLLPLAMQKVVGSNPIIRSGSPCKTARSVVWRGNSASLMVTLRCDSCLADDSDSEPGSPAGASGSFERDVRGGQRAGTRDGSRRSRKHLLPAPIPRVYRLVTSEASQDRCKQLARRYARAATMPAAASRPASRQVALRPPVVLADHEEASGVDPDLEPT